MVDRIAHEAYLLRRGMICEVVAEKVLNESKVAVLVAG